MMKEHWDGGHAISRRREVGDGENVAPTSCCLKSVWQNL